MYSCYERHTFLAYFMQYLIHMYMYITTSATKISTSLTIVQLTPEATLKYAASSVYEATSQRPRQ